MGFYVRRDMANITVLLDDVPVGDLWATCEGGALEADDQKTRPGGMKRQVAIGGPTSRSDMTVTTQFTDLMVGPAKDFENRSGRGKITITVTYLDQDGNADPGRAFTRTGIVKSAQIPVVDVNAGDVSFLTVVGSMHEVNAT
jgi:hypothetical protein